MKIKDEIFCLKDKKVSLAENHQMILEIFDACNSLLNNEFDCFYTGGLMFFIHNNDSLKRYHNDLDLFVNEEQLFELKSIIDKSDKFKFISNMYKKEVNGHEYKITYRDYPISIGLFLFERKNDGGIITKKYYYDDLPNMNNLCVDERHFNAIYSNLVFNNNVFYRNNLAYKMLTLEFIYYSKIYLKPHRDKDDYDISYISDKIDNNLVAAIDIEKKKKKDIIHKMLNESIILEIEKDLVDKTKTRLRNI